MSEQEKLPPTQWEDCGSYAAVQRHRKAREMLDPACHAEKNRYNREHCRDMGRVRMHALKALRDAHEEEFQELLEVKRAEHKKRDPEVSSAKLANRARSAALVTLSQRYSFEYNRLRTDEALKAMLAPPPVEIRQHSFLVSCLPEDHPDAYAFTLKVEDKGRGRWAVMWVGHGVLGTDGEWSYDPFPTSQEDEWLKTHRFDRAEALKLAEKVAPTLKIRDYTVIEALMKETS